ncbi:MAG: lipid II:glycine glycyltransferase FemX [Candidatus Saccharicenans sp.]
MIVKPIEIKWTPDIPIFAAPDFLKAVGDESGWLGGFDEANRLLCYLPFTIIKKPFFKLVRFRIETILLDQNLKPEEEKRFLNLVVDYFKKVRADVIIPATTNSIFRTYPDGATAAPYGTFKIDLTRTENEIWQGMSSSHRRKIRLALKEGVRIRTGLEYSEIAYQLIKDTFNRSKIRFMSYSSFLKYLQGLGEYVRIFVAEKEGKYQAALVIPFSLPSAYYVYGGSCPEPIVGATNLLHWEAIKYFKFLGVKCYDFVGVRIDPEKGSKQEGLSQYKERFGGELYRGFIWKYKLNPVKYYGYEIAVRILKGGDIVDQEKHKLRNYQV